MRFEVRPTILRMLAIITVSMATPLKVVETGAIEQPIDQKDPSILYSGGVTRSSGSTEGGLRPWEFTTSLTVDRREFAALALDDHVYVLGGESYQDGQLASVEWAEAESTGNLGPWNSTTQMPTPRVAFSAVISGSYVYALGGYYQIGNDFYRLDTVDRAQINEAGGFGAWFTATQIIDARASLAAVSTHGRIFVIGGIDATGVMSSVISSPVNPNGSLGSWQIETSMPTARDQLAAVTFGSYVYAIGGRNLGDHVVGVVERAHLDASGSIDVWESMPSLIQPRLGAAAVVANGFIFVSGGWNETAQGTILDTVEYARINPDGSLGAWDFTSPLRRPRSGLALITTQNDIYSLGGVHIGDKTQVERTSWIDPVGPVAQSLEINGGALSTTSTDVALDLAANDSTDSIDSLRFRLSNNEAFWSGWAPYSASSPWDLIGGDGTKRVFVQYRDAVGNLSVPISQSIQLDTSAGVDYGLTINSGALFTNDTQVSLGLGARAHTAEMQVSNDGGFAGAVWEPYSSIKVWSITQYGNYVIPRVVYSRYKGVDGSTSGVFQDDIILDVTPPTGTVSLMPSNSMVVASPALTTAAARILTNPGQDYSVFLPLINRESCVEMGAANTILQLNATDDVSGVYGLWISNDPGFVCAIWELFQSSRPWHLPTGVATVYVKFSDNAGNVSSVVQGTLAR